MSARCTGAVFERYPEGGGEFVLALALADNAHQDGTHIFISVDSMAEKSRQSVRTVQAHLRAMLDRGWLLVTRVGGGRGRYAEYRINPAWLNGAELAPFTPPSEPPENSEKGAGVAGFDDEKRVRNDALKGAKSRIPYITDRTIPPLTPPAGGERQCEKPQTREPGFDGAFWAHWPKKVDEKNARRAWRKLAPDAKLQGEIAQAIQAWMRSPEWRIDNGRWIPKPSKWLRGQRWRDIPGIAAPPPPPVATPAPAPVLTVEQLAANGEKARAAAAHARALLGAGRVSVPA